MLRLCFTLELSASLFALGGKKSVESQIITRAALRLFTSLAKLLKLENSTSKQEVRLRSIVMDKSLFPFACSKKCGVHLWIVSNVDGFKPKFSCKEVCVTA